MTRLVLILVLCIVLTACGGSGTGDPAPDRSSEPVHCLPEVVACQ